VAEQIVVDAEPADDHRLVEDEGLPPGVPAPRGRTVELQQVPPFPDVPAVVEPERGRPVPVAREVEQPAPGPGGETGRGVLLTARGQGETLDEPGGTQRAGLGRGQIAQGVLPARPLGLESSTKGL